jgi:ribosome-associated translation inhibitor RaiA
VALAKAFNHDNTFEKGQVMAVKVNASNLKIEDGNQTLDREQAIEYAKTETAKILESLGYDNTETTITLKTEGQQGRLVQKVETKVVTNGVVICQQAHSRSLKKAIEKTLPELKRQLSDNKARRVAKKAKERRAENSVAKIESTVAIAENFFEPEDPYEYAC